MKKIEVNFDPTKVVLVCTTSYPNWYPGERKSFGDTEKVRGDLALEFLNSAEQFGYNVVFSDYNSSPDFLRQLSKYKVRFIQLQRDESTRAAGRRAGLIAGSQIPGVEILILTEPEKVSLVKDCIPIIVDPLMDNQADIVVPGRKDDLFAASYPSYMRSSEVELNRKFSELMRMAKLLPDNLVLDVAFGPVALRSDKRILDLFLEEYQFTDSNNYDGEKFTDPEDWCNARSLPIIKALWLTAQGQKYRVTSAPVPFVYSKEQKMNEESTEAIASFKKKRKRQRLGDLTVFVRFVHFLEGNQLKGKLELV